MSLTRLSKFISLILRHQPQVIGITLDEHGWADVGELLEMLEFKPDFLKKPVYRHGDA